MRITISYDLFDDFGEGNIIVDRLDSSSFTIEEESGDAKIWINKNQIDEVIEILQQIQIAWLLKVDECEKELSDLCEKCKENLTKDPICQNCIEELEDAEYLYRLRRGDIETELE